MTIDERLNKLEDQLKKIVEAINHNNKVNAKFQNETSAQLKELHKKPAGDMFTDIFNNSFKGKSR